MPTVPKINSVRPNSVPKYDFRNCYSSRKTERNLSESKKYTRERFRMAQENRFSLKKVGKTQYGSKVRAKTPIMSNFAIYQVLRYFLSNSIKLTSKMFSNDI